MCSGLNHYFFKFCLSESCLVFHFGNPALQELNFLILYLMIFNPSFLFSIYLSPWVLVAVRGALGAGSAVAARSVPCGIFVTQPGIEPTSPTLAGRFSTTGSPGKSRGIFIIYSLLAEGSVFWRWEPFPAPRCHHGPGRSSLSSPG